VRTWTLSAAVGWPQACRTKRDNGFVAHCPFQGRSDHVTATQKVKKVGSYFLQKLLFVAAS
jgi:hypothetical protein